MKRGGPIARRTPLRATPPTPEERRAKQDRSAARARERQAERARAQIDSRRVGVNPPDTAASRRSGGINRRPIPRDSPRSGSKGGSTPDPVTPATRAAVARRSGGYCEARVASRCAGVGQHVHHRKLRRHGDHRACNLLHVCLACHTHIHSSAFAAEAWRRRFLVRSNLDPEDEPVRLAA